MNCLSILFLAGAALTLAACNESGPGSATPTTSLTAASGKFNLPTNAPCAGEIGRYQSIVKSDLDTGNVERQVYDQIEKELARAAAACSAGRGGESHNMVAASKERHGYRA